MLWFRAVALFACSVLIGCAAAGPTTLEAALGERGVDVAALFAAPTAAELDAVRADWAGRDLAPRDVEVLHEETLSDGRRLLIVGHGVHGARHVGALIAPARDAPSPPGGFPLALSLIGFGPPFEVTVTDPPPQGDDAAPVIALLPAFRGHTMIRGDQRFEAGGARYDQCDGGSDDALAFAQVAATLEPRARTDRIVSVGGSRGGNVSLILGARDPRVVAVASLAGPTSYLRRDWLDHPNLRTLYEEWFVRGLLEGTSDLAEARRRMIACSPTLFVADLPPTQLHHGTGDLQVPVDTVDALEVAWNRERTDADTSLEVFRYPDEGHALAESLDLINPRISAFLAPLLTGD
ncbi:MAG: prolyl oligopeptidase family serine peptidase [Myxococcota bacterium]